MVQFALYFMYKSFCSSCLNDRLLLYGKANLCCFFFALGIQLCLISLTLNMLGAWEAIVQHYRFVAAVHSSVTLQCAPPLRRTELTLADRAQLCGSSIRRKGGAHCRITFPFPQVCFERYLFDNMTEFLVFVETRAGFSLPWQQLE